MERTSVATTATASEQYDVVRGQTASVPWSGASLHAGRLMLAPMPRSEPDPRALQPGDAFGEYVIDDQLGEGGMGIVFRAIRDGRRRSSR